MSATGSAMMKRGGPTAAKKKPISDANYEFDDDDGFPTLDDPFAGANLQPHQRSMLGTTKMRQQESERLARMSELERQIEVARNKAFSEGRNPENDAEVERLTIQKLQDNEKSEAAERYLAAKITTAVAHQTAVVKSIGSRVPSHELARHAFWPDRRVPDDQTAHVMWARALSFFNKYAQLSAMQNMSSRSNGKCKALYMPAYHDYVNWIEQRFLVPVVFVRRNSAALQTWLGEEDRQPVFFMQYPDAIPMPQRNSHGAFLASDSQHDDLFHEVRYLNMLELVSLALLSTARPGACFECDWDTTLPAVDAYDICPDRIKEHRFVWTEEKSRLYGGDRVEARRHVLKHFPENRIEIYETFLRFDRASFVQRGAEFDDNADTFQVRQHREVVFDQFYYGAHTFEEAGEDGVSAMTLHGEMQRMFRCRAEDDNNYARLFPSAAQVVEFLTDSENFEWSERRRTSPYDVVVDPTKGNAAGKGKGENGAYARQSLEEFTRNQQRKPPPPPSSQAESANDNGTTTTSTTVFSAVESGNDEPTSEQRREQKADEMKRKHAKTLGGDHADATDLPYYGNEVFNIARVDTSRAQWAMPTSGTNDADGTNMPRRLTKYQYYRAFLYLAMRNAEKIVAKGEDFSALILPLHCKEAMQEMRKWLNDRRKRQRQVPNFRAWAADVLKGANAWMTRVVEAVEYCFTNDPGRAAATNEDRIAMWRKVEALFPPGIVSLMPTWTLRDKTVPPQECDMPVSFSASSSSPPSAASSVAAIPVSDVDRKIELLAQQRKENADAFGAPIHPVTKRLYQELFCDDEARHKNWLEDCEKGRSGCETLYWEDSRRQSLLQKTGNGAPSRLDRLNPILCSRHFRTMIMPAGGVCMPAFSQREHWLPAFYKPENVALGERSGKKEGEEGEEKEEEEERDWLKMRAGYKHVSEHLFPTSGRARAYSAPAAVQGNVVFVGGNGKRRTVAGRHASNKTDDKDYDDEYGPHQPFSWQPYRDKGFLRHFKVDADTLDSAFTDKNGGDNDDADVLRMREKEKTRKQEADARLAAATARSAAANNAAKLAERAAAATSATGADNAETWAQKAAVALKAAKDAAEEADVVAKACFISDAVTPAEVTRRLHDQDKNFDKRHPNIVHGDVFSIGNGDDDGHVDALFSIVCEPLMDARMLHTNPQPEYRGAMDCESNPIFIDSVQRPLANNSFYCFFHMIVDVCNGNPTSNVTVEEWEQIEEFCRRVLLAYEAVEYDQSQLTGDRRFLYVDRRGMLQPNQKLAVPNGEQPKEVQAGVRALQTIAYATRMARMSQVLHRVETMLSYVPWIYRGHVLQHFEGQDSPFSTLYDYGVNAVVSMRENAVLRPESIRWPRQRQCADEEGKTKEKKEEKERQKKGEKGKQKIEEKMRVFEEGVYVERHNESQLHFDTAGTIFVEMRKEEEGEEEKERSTSSSASSSVVKPSTVVRINRSVMQQWLASNSTDNTKDARQVDTSLYCRRSTRNIARLETTDQKRSRSSFKK